MMRLDGELPSADGVAARLEAGLAAMGDPVVMGVATESTGAMPVCGEDTAEAPGEAPPRLFCRGDRGLCAAGRNVTGMHQAAVFPGAYVVIWQTTPVN